ncbi:MAG TPA: TonB family protein [Thermoanaerobaculia bacterium]|nr:TonB family protein [Thermoanaerobaculia bacterium]
MFETSVIQARAKARSRRPLLFSFSIAAHAAVIITVVATSLASVTLPKRAPNQVTIPVFTHLEPMLGGGSEHKKTPAATPPVKREVTPATPATPNVVPNTVVPAASQPPSTSDAGPASDGPASDAPPGPGVPWGKKDGVLVDGPPAVTPPASETIYTVSGDVKAPRVLRRVSPPYPELARRARLNGFVILECIIDQSGHIRDAKVLQSSFAAFEQPALDAIRQWEFAPGTLNGQPVNVQFNLTVSFHVN